MLLKFVRSVLLWSAFFTASFFVYVFSANAAEALNLQEPSALSLQEPSALNLQEPSALNLREPSALNLQEPSALCDRYDLPKERRSCREFVKKNQPDTYVASACNTVEDDKIFRECLKLASKAEIDPHAVATCTPEKLSDSERLGCLQKLAADPSKDKFQRLPANISGKKTPKAP